MNNNDIQSYYKELNVDDKIVCTKSELNSFLLAGLLFETGNTYINRNFKPIQVDIIKNKELKFNIDLQELIISCEQKSKENNCKRIYCMSSKTFDHYKTLGLVVQKDNNDYYRLFDNELWLINLI